MKRKYGSSCFIILLVAAMAITGCKRSSGSTAENKDNKNYTLPQVMLVAATEKNRYEEVYTDQVWEIKLGSEDITFEQYLKSQVENFLNELNMMNMLAQQKGITLTSAEKEQVRELSEAYYAGLTNEDIRYMKIEKEDVRYMYEEYHIANKLVNELTKDMDLEVSDNEAKVVTVNQIKLNDKEAADAVYQKVTAQGANFESIAKSDSADTIIKRQIGRGEAAQVLEDAAFALEEGQISSVTESEGAYYIFQSVSAYDEKATQEKKKKLSAEKKNLAFRQIYDQFLAENPVEFNHDSLSHISFAETDETTTTNFFDLYREYMPD